MRFAEMTEERMREYVDFLLRHYRLTDAYWFLGVEDTFGTDAAVRLNEDIWTRMGKIAARDIKERFPLEEEGIGRVLEALSYFPWAIITRFQVEEHDGVARITVPYCPPQAARLRTGRGEFPCKAMHLGEFENFAKEIDGRAEVRCLMAPPDPHPEDLWCKWELRLSE